MPTGVPSGSVTEIEPDAVNVTWSERSAAFLAPAAGSEHEQHREQHARGHPPGRPPPHGKKGTASGKGVPAELTVDPTDEFSDRHSSGYDPFVLRREMDVLAAMRAASTVGAGSPAGTRTFSKSARATQLVGTPER